MTSTGKRCIETAPFPMPPMKKIPRLSKPPDASEAASRPIYPHVALRDAGGMIMKKLPTYDIPLELMEAESDPSSDSPILKNYKTRQSEIRTNAYDYINGYKAMVFMEEAADMHNLHKFKHTGIRLLYDGANESYFFANEKRLSTINNAFEERIVDSFRMVPQRTSIVLDGRLTGKNMSQFFCVFNKSLVATMHPDTVYDITFHINQQPYQLQHQALDFVYDHNLFPLLIRNPMYFYQSEYNDSDDHLPPLTGSFADELNDEQTIAVQNIVNANNVPLPYIIFGPPGTGKTRTLVAAVDEIITTTDKCVLVCANSNAACDEITERLARVLTSDDMFRLYSKTSDARHTKQWIKPMCNLRDDSFVIPSLAFLYQFRVVICTLATAGCFARGRHHEHFRADHFAYVFIDECASTNEPTALVAIAGVCTSYNKVHSSIILAGDPKQLDAVTRSSNAAGIGYKTSLMEHLANLPRYQKHAQRGYDTRYITQLVKNYRSHSAILRFPNTMFYGSSLQALAPPAITDWFINSNLLPSKNFPIIFKSVHGKCQQSYQDTSLCNIKEVNEVVHYIQKLLITALEDGRCLSEEDIGVVSPYKLQCRRIGQACRSKGYHKITIGTAEMFQGQEKPIMIVSTVRAGGSCTSFLNDPRRLNVIITRAKCLLVVIGDPHTLSKMTFWQRFIRYCVMNNALIQSERPFKG